MPSSAWTKPATPSGVTPDEVKGSLSHIGKKSYISEKLKKGLKAVGANRLLYRTGTKHQYLEAIEDLQEEGIVGENIDPNKEYREILKSRMFQQKPIVKVNMGLQHLPNKVEARHVFSAMENNANSETFSRFKTVMDRLGFNQHTMMTEDKVKMVMYILRDKERVAVPANIGPIIKRQLTTAKANVLAAIQSELTEEEQQEDPSQYIDSGGRYSYQAKRHMPKGVKSSAGSSNAVTSVGKSGRGSGVKNTTSAIRGQIAASAGKNNKPTTSATHRHSGNIAESEDMADKKQRAIQDLFLE